jgi:hypothetical protein
VHCGEQRLRSEDRNFRQIVGHALEATTNINGKLLLTVRTLLREPGRLTADYLRGRRQPYLPPLQLFFFANLLFFLLHPLIGSNTLTTALNTHLHYTWHHQIADHLVASRLTQRALTADAYAAIFDAASVTQAKSLVILVVPIFAGAVAALYWRQRRNFAAHLVFAAHFCTLWLLLICATLALTNLVIRLLRTVDVFPSAEQVSLATLAILLGVTATYLFRAARTAFVRQATWLTAAKAITLGVAFDLSLEAYRCALFFITFWST